VPAHSASEDARERAYLAGFHDFLRPQAAKTWMAGTTSPAMTRCLWLSASMVAALALATPEGSAAEDLRPYTVFGDAIPASLTGQKGNPERGRAIVGNRQVGLCLLCHRGPFPEEKFQGTVAPDLAGAGTRWSEGQLRLRIVDSRRINPDSIMPSYYRVDGLTRVAANFAGKPILTAEQIEDVVSYLITLRDEESKDR
jgi:L-cysteine S-thiosulfotransferase